MVRKYSAEIIGGDPRKRVIIRRFFRLEFALEKMRQQMFEFQLECWLIIVHAIICSRTAESELGGGGLMVGVGSRAPSQYYTYI